MNKHILSTSIALLLCLGACAQGQQTVKNKTAVKFSAGINKTNAYKHLSVLASDEYEGRETGKKGAWMAAEYIKNHFKSIGLKGPVKGDYFQPVGMMIYKLGQTVFTINGQVKKVEKDYMMPAYNVAPQGFNINTKEIIFAGYGIDSDDYNDYAGIDVTDKVVMIFASGGPVKDEPVPTDRAARRKHMSAKQAKMKYLANHKAAAIIMIEPALDTLNQEMKARYTDDGYIHLKTEETIKRMTNLKSFPVVDISVATANELLKAAGTTVEEVQQKMNSTGKPVTQTINVAVSATAVKHEINLKADNVLGFLEGSDPVLKKEILVVTAHYDHIGLTTSGTDKVNNGADDDGSGTTGVLLIADAFAKAKQAGKGPKRSILFMTVVGEEKGLLGSQWYSEYPVFPLKNTITNLNIDMIGRVDKEHEDKPDYIYIIGSDMLSSDLNAIGINANEQYMKMNLDMKYNNRTDPNQFYYRSDHYNFAKHGIPVIFYFNGVHEDYHQPGDEISKIKFDLLARRAQLVYYTAWDLANRPIRPVVDKNEDGTPTK